MSYAFPLEILRVSGSNYEIGSQIGSSSRAKITKFVESNEMLEKIRERVDARKIEKLRQFAGRHFPQYMEEIRGISDGSGVAYEDLVLLNFKYEIASNGCSTLISKIGDNIILGHNEDGDRKNEENAFLLIAKPLGGTPFFAYCYPGMIPGNAFSFNSHGIVMTGNAMPTPDLRIGVPRHLIDRSMLEATTMEDALGRALFPKRASGFSYNLVSLGERRAVNLETTSEGHCVTEVGDRLFHTNHYVSAGLRDIAQRIGKSSLVRYRQGYEMMHDIDEVSERRLREILFSAANKPYSIYASGGLGSSWTLCTAIFEVSDDIQLKVYARKERNCRPLTFSSSIFRQ